MLQERDLAESIGGRVQPGSGAPAFYKSDAVAQLSIRTEAKTTSKKQFTLTKAVLDKIRNEALVGGQEDWALQVEFQGQFKNARFAVIDWNQFEYLKQIEKEHKVCGTKPDEALSKEDCG